jgi:hypothetical protein
MTPALGNPPLLPDDGWISIATIANAMSGHPDPIISAAERLGIPMETGRGWPAVRVQDLEALVGPQWARSLRYGRDPELIRRDPAAELLGVHHSEVVALCVRRGVLVDQTRGEALLSRSGVIILRRLLGREQRAPIAATDWLRGELALARVRAVQATVRVPAFGTDAIDVTDPNRPRRPDLADLELVERLGWLQCRWKREQLGKTTYGKVLACGFDLYRLLGVEGLPGQDLESYRAIMGLAYEEIVGPAPQPTP